MQEGVLKDLERQEWKHMQKLSQKKEVERIKNLTPSSLQQD